MTPPAAGNARIVLDQPTECVIANLKSRDILQTHEYADLSRAVGAPLR